MLLATYFKSLDNSLTVSDSVTSFTTSGIYPGPDKYLKFINTFTFLTLPAIKGEEIDDLIVNPKFQGKGYGKQLLLWALEHVDTERVILHVAEWNKRAVKLYTKNGFEIIETIPI